MTRRTPTPRAVLGVSSLGVFMAFVDATIVNIAFPDIGRDFQGAPISELSWVLNAYNIVFAAFLVAAGRLADLIGRRRVFIFGLNVFTFASLLCAVAPTVGTLIAARVLQALGAALLVPSSLALVLSAFPVERRSHGVALLSAIAALAAGLGPSLGGLLVELSDWRLVFLVNIPLGIAAAVLSARVLVESREPGRRLLPDLVGALLFAPAVGALVYAVTEGDRWGWTSLKTLGTVGFALVLGVLFVRRCRTHRAPMIDLSLLRIRTFTVANAMTIVTAAGFFGYTLINVLFLTGVWRYGVLEAGLSLTPGPFVAAAVAGPTSKLVIKHGHRPVLVAGGLIWAGAVMWMVTQVGPTPNFMGEWLPGIVLLGIGAGTLFPNLSGAAVAAAPGEAHGTAVGLNSVARQIGAAFGVAIVLAILGRPETIPEAVDAFDNAWTFSAVCLAVAGLGCLAVSRLTPHDEGGGVVSFADAFSAVLREPAPQPPPRPRNAVRPVIAATGNTPGIPRAESAADFLGQVPLFAGVGAVLREQLAAEARDVRLPVGEALFEEGDDGDAMYVVRAGRLEVVAADGHLLRELGRGSALGELALLTSMPRSASVRAARDTDLLAIDRVAFEHVLETAPELSRALNRILADQLRTPSSGPGLTRPLPVTVAIVALEPGVDVGAFADALGAALGSLTTAVRLDASDAPDPGAFGPVVDRAERDAELVLLVGAGAFSDDAWTAFCLQQADRILALTRGGPVDPAAATTASLHGCDLVAVDVEPGSGKLAGWVEALAPEAAHHDAARLARRLSGRSVGLVLSGGGARAFAHLGVIEELVGAGIEIDRVSGVSFGAFIGALFAQGLDPETIDARCFDEWVRGRPLGDYRPSRQGLIRGTRLEATLERTFDAVAIEELPRSFSCTSAELRSGRLVVARSGLLRDAVGMSMRLPLLSPPAVRGKELHVDGSLIDNLPVELLAATGEGPVIAVPVDGGLSSHVADGPPGVAETLARVVALGSVDSAEAARRHATLTITPHAEGVGLLEFHQIDAAREAGRVAARQALETAADSVFG